MRVFSENYKDKRPNGETIVRTRWVVEWANGFRVFSTQRSANQFASEAA